MLLVTNKPANGFQKGKMTRHGPVHSIFYELSELVKIQLYLNFKYRSDRTLGDFVLTLRSPILKESV